MARKDLSTDPINLKAMWTKAKKFYQELKKTGLSDIAIAAILGNIAQESSFNPKARAGSYSGYIQNQKEIVNWVIKNFGGYDHIHQMNYLIAGLTQKLPDKISQWGKELNKRFNTFLQGLTNNISVAQATKLWESSYEKSGGQELQKRINYANYFYDQILNEKKQVSQPKKPKLKQKNKVVAQQIPQINYPQEILTMDQSQPEYTAQTNYTNNNLPLFFDFKNYQFDQEPVSQNAQQATTEFDLPLFATNYKNGGKLIKRGQQGMKVVQTAPFNVEIYLEKDPISHPELQTYIPGLDPEERMDAVVQQLAPQYNPITNKVNQNSTYQPTIKQQNLQMIPYDDPAGNIMTGIITLPFGGTAVKYTPKLGQIIWGAIKQTMKNPKPFLKNLFYDTGSWIALNEGTRLATGETADQKLNWWMGFPKNEGPAFLLTGTAAGIGRRLATKGINLASQALSPEYALKVNLQNSIESSPLITQTPEGVFIQNQAKETVQPLTQESIQERAAQLAQQLKNLQKDLGEETVQLYSDKEAEEIKRLAVVLGLKPKNGIDGDVTFVGQINRNEPLDQALVNLYNYRIKNNFTPVQDNISLPNYIVNTSNGLDFINASNNPEKYITSLTKQPIIASIQKNYSPGVSGFRMTTDVGRAHSQIHTTKTPLETKITTIHENIGHGMNPLAKYYQSDTFGGKTMQQVYEDLANNIWNPIAAQTQYREYTLPWIEIQAEVSNINSFILKRLQKVYNMSPKQILELSEKQPEKLDLMFKTVVDDLSAEELQSMLSTLGSRYARQMIRFMPGSNGLATQDQVFNFMARPQTPSNEQFLYDTLKQLRDKNSQYTKEQANAYLNTFKNILKYGFSILGLGTSIENQN